MVALVAESNISVRFEVWKVLKADGVTILMAKDGEEALQVVQMHSGEIDLLITEMELPRVGGIDLYQRILTGRPATKAVVMVGSELPDYVALPGVHVLRKPFTGTALRETIVGIMGLPSEVLPRDKQV